METIARLEYDKVSPSTGLDARWVKEYYIVHEPETWTWELRRSIRKDGVLIGDDVLHWEHDKNDLPYSGIETDFDKAVKFGKAKDIEEKHKADRDTRELAEQRAKDEARLLVERIGRLAADAKWRLANALIPNLKHIDDSISPETIRAKMWGHWVIHESFNKRGYKPKWYALTHSNSGLCAKESEDRDYLKRVAVVLETCGADWDFQSDDPQEYKKHGTDEASRAVREYDDALKLLG